MNELPALGDNFAVVIESDREWSALHYLFGGWINWFTVLRGF